MKMIFFLYVSIIHDHKRTLCNIYGGTEMMDNIYEEYASMEDFKMKALNGDQPSLGKAVDNSVIYIMDDNLRP